MDGQPMSMGPLDGSVPSPHRSMAVAVLIVGVVLAVMLAAPLTGRIGALLASSSTTEAGSHAASRLRVAEGAAGAYVPVMPLVAQRLDEARRRAEQAAAEAADHEGRSTAKSGSEVSSSASVSAGGASASASGRSTVRSSARSSSASSAASSSVRVSNSSSASVGSSGSATARVSSSQKVSGSAGATCRAESHTFAEVVTSEGVVSDSDHDVDRTC